jgi:opacity protein-like surface antigen
MTCLKQTINATWQNLRPAVAGAALAAVLLPAHAPRAEEWTGSATVYGWLPWMDLKSSPKNGTGSTDVSLSLKDILENLKFAFFAAGDVHYGRVGILQDFVYADLGFDGRLSGPLAAKVEIDQKMFISTTVLGYQVYAEDGFLIEPYAGARYVDTKTDLTIKSGGQLGTKLKGFVEVDWWDPVIGVRGRMPLTEKLDATGFANIGGFGAGSKFSWEIFGGLDYALSESVSTNAGFRYLSIDYDGDSADVHLEIYGPTVGLTLRF